MEVRSVRGVWLSDDDDDDDDDYDDGADHIQCGRISPEVSLTSSHIQ